MEQQSSASKLPLSLEVMPQGETDRTIPRPLTKCKDVKSTPLDSAKAEMVSRAISIVVAGSNTKETPIPRAEQSLKTDKSSIIEQTYNSLFERNAPDSEYQSAGFEKIPGTSIWRRRGGALSRLKEAAQRDRAAYEAWQDEKRVTSSSHREASAWRIDEREGSIFLNEESVKADTRRSKEWKPDSALSDAEVRHLMHVYMHGCQKVFENEFIAYMMNDFSERSLKVFPRRDWSMLRAAHKDRKTLAYFRSTLGVLKPQGLDDLWTAWENLQKLSEENFKLIADFKLIKSWCMSIFSRETFDGLILAHDLSVAYRRPETPVELKITMAIRLATSPLWKKVGKFALLEFFLPEVTALSLRLQGADDPSAVSLDAVLQKIPNKEDLAALMDSSLAARMTYLMTSFFSTTFFSDLDIGSQLALEALRVQGARKFADANFFLDCLSFLKDLVHRCMTFCKSGKITDLLGQSELESHLFQLETYTRKLQDSSRVRLASDEFKCLKEIKAYALRLSRNTNKSVIWNDLFKYKQRAFIEALAEYERCDPISDKSRTLGIIIHGEPGLGKSNIVDGLMTAYKHRKKIPQSTKIALKLDLNAGFPEDVPNAKFIVMDDMFSSKEKPGQDTMKLLASMVERSGVRIEGASIDQKKRSNIDPSLVWLSTNSYTFDFTNAVSGYGKLDRRYLSILREATEDLKAFCKKRGIAADRYWQDFFWNKHRNCGVDYRDGSKDFINTVGYMDNSTKDLHKGGTKNVNGTVHFKPVHDLRVFTTDRELLAYLNGLIMENEKLMSEKPPAPELCECGLPAMDRCPCGFAGEIKMAPPPIKEELPVLTSPFTMLKAAFASGSPQPQKEEEEEEPPANEAWNEEEAAAVWLQHQGANSSKVEVVTDPDGGELYTEGDDESDEHYQLRMQNELGYLSGLSNYMTEEVQDSIISTLGGAAAVVTALGLVYGAISLVTLMARSYAPPTDKQSAMGPVIAGVEPADAVPRKVVECIKKNLAPWSQLPTDKSNVVPISYDGRCMFAICILPCLWVAPRHLFTKGQHLPEESLPEEGQYILGRTTIYFRKNYLWQPKTGKDLVALYVPFYPSCPAGIYRALTTVIDYTRPVIFKGVPGAAQITNLHGADLVFIGCEGRNGDCGTPYFQEGSIVAMHTLGDHTGKEKKTGGVALRKGDIDAVIEHFNSLRMPVNKPVEYVDPAIERLVQQSGDIVPPGDIANMAIRMTPEELADQDNVLLGRLPSKNKARMTGGKTTYYSFFEHRLPKHFARPHTGHALESAGYSSPYTRSLEMKRGRLNGFVFKAADHIVDVIRSTGESGLGFVSLVQALVGDPRNHLLGPTDDSKSVGYLHALHKRKREVVFPKNGMVTTPCPEFFERRSVLLKAAQRGVQSVVIESAALKDEMITEEKVAAGKGRLFMVSEKEVNVLLKEQTSNICSVFIKHWKKTGCVLALNPGGQDWDDMTQRLLSVDGLYFDGDFRYFDGSHSVMLSFAFHVICRCAEALGYSEHELRTLMSFLETVRCKVMEIEGFLVFRSSKLSSGIYLTIMVNCIINWLITLSWIMSVAAEHQLTINYETEVFDPKVGDDLLLALSKKYCAMPCFHPDRLRDWADDLGYDLTSSDKSPDLRWKQLEEVQLVKRNFRFDVDTGKWMGCLDKTSIYKMVCYSTKTKVSQAERDQSAALCACKETYLHGREEYETFKAICDANGIKCWSWEELDSAYRRDVLKVWDSGDDLESADAQETESPVTQAATIEVDSRPKESSLSMLLPDNSAGAAEGTGLDSLQHQSKDVSPDREASMNTRSTEINSSEGMSFSSAHGTLNNMGSMEAPKVDLTSVTAPAKLDEETIPDRNRLAGVYRRIGTFSWSTATVTQNLDAWLSYITLAPIISNFTSQYQYFRGSPKIRVSYTGASSYLGQARVFMVPVRVQDTTSINALAQDDYTTLGTNQYARSASVPHIDLDASLSCVCELSVPYVASSEFEMSPTVNDWKIYFQPFFLAKADTTAPNTLSVTIELCYPDLCVFNLTPQGGDDSSSFLSSLLSYGKKFGRAYISPAVAVAKWGVSVAESLGFSRPPEENMQQIVRRGFSNMAAVSGANDGVIHLGVDPRQMVDMTPANLPGPELNTFDEFLRKRHQVICSTLSAYSTGYAMGPDVFPNTFGSTLEYPTPLNVYTMMFTQWRGSFTARVTVYSSPLIRMRIGVNVIPPNTAAIAGFTANGSCLSKIVEIAGTTTFDVEIPWMFPTLSVATQMVQFNSNVRPRMYLWILEGPNGTAAACATPQFAVDLIPGADFEATRPTLDIWNTYLTLQGKLADAMGAKIESFTELAKRCSPVGVFRPSALAAVASSNMITLPRDLPILNAGNSMVWTGGAAADQLEWIEVSWSFLTLIRAISYGYRGSSIFRVTVNSIDGSRTVNGPVTTPTWFSLSKTYSQIGASLTTVGTGTLACGVPFVGQGVQYFENGVIEVSVPDYALERFTNTMIGGVPTAVLITDSVTMGIRPASLTNGVSYQVSYAAGDDVRFGMYMPPCITPRL